MNYCVPKTAMVPVIFPKYQQKTYATQSSTAIRERLNELAKRNLEFTEEVQCDWRTLISFRGSILFESLPMYCATQSMEQDQSQQQQQQQQQQLL